MRKVVLPALVFLFSCNKNPADRNLPGAYFSFKQQFTERPAGDFHFRSDSLIDTRMLKKTERGDTLFSRYMAPILIENGGYYYGKFTRGSGLYDLFVFLADADIPGPVFTVISKFGKGPVHFTGYRNPGYDAGFESVEFCGLDSKSQLYFRDQTRTWNPEDSLSEPLKTSVLLQIYNPLSRGDFEATYTYPVTVSE